MRIKIIATIFIFFYSGFLGFSQSRTLLHTFERHLHHEPRSNLNGIIYFYGERNEDYTIRLFSDSTFTITYFYKATGNYYPNYKTFETINGSLFNNAGVIYLVRNNPAIYSTLFSLHEISFGTSVSKKLEQMLSLGVTVKIEYSENSLALYSTGEWSMIFTKKNSLKFNNPI